MNFHFTVVLLISFQLILKVVSERLSITTRTSTCPDAGSNAHIYFCLQNPIILKSEREYSMGTIKGRCKELDNPGRNDFEGGYTDIFEIEYEAETWATYKADDNFFVYNKFSDNDPWLPEYIEVNQMIFSQNKWQPGEIIAKHYGPTKCGTTWGWVKLGTVNILNSEDTKPKVHPDVIVKLDKIMEEQRAESLKQKQIHELQTSVVKQQSEAIQHQNSVRESQKSVVKSQNSAIAQQNDVSQWLEQAVSDLHEFMEEFEQMTTTPTTTTQLPSTTTTTRSAVSPENPGNYSNQNPNDVFQRLNTVIQEHGRQMENNKDLIQQLNFDIKKLEYRVRVMKPCD